VRCGYEATAACHSHWGDRKVRRAYHKVVKTARYQVVNNEADLEAQQ
jgi:hypothetical protein